MLKNLLNLLFVLALAAMAFPFVTGRDITGVPASTAAMDCGFIADHFTGLETDLDYTLRKIQRVDGLEVLERTERSLTCRGLAFLQGSPSTYVRLTSVENSSGNFALAINQALPAEYTCDLLAQEVTMKFSRETFGVLGTIVAITKTDEQLGGAAIQCQGNAKFSSGLTFPVSYAYDGKLFSVTP